MLLLLSLLLLLLLPQVTARFDGALPLWGISELKSNAVGKANRSAHLSPIANPVKFTPCKVDFVIFYCLFVQF